MKVAVSSTGPGLDSQVDPRFGRCAYFIIVESETMDFEAIENPNVMAMGGAGIQSAQLIANKGAEVVLTGNCGPNAFQTFSAAGVKIIIGVVGTVKDAVKRFKGGELQPAMQSNVASHFGMGGSPGMMPGMGGGRGMGRGRGGGMMGGFGTGPVPGQPFASPAPPQGGPGGGELKALLEQTKALQEQLQEMSHRLEQVEKKIQ